MTDRIGFATLFVVVAVVLAAVPAGALTAMSADTGTTASDHSNASNASMGANVSAFMQASTADAEGEVDDGMFNARFEDAPGERRSELVRGRAANLEERLETLRAERAALLNETDGTPTVAERAKAARLSAQIDALENAVNTTSTAADRAGVDLSRLDELRQGASTLKGQAVAELATGMAGKGPWSDDGSPGRSGDAGNGSQGNVSDPGDRGNESDGQGPSGPGENPGEGQPPADPGNDDDDAESA